MCAVHHALSKIIKNYTEWTEEVKRKNSNVNTFQIAAECFIMFGVSDHRRGWPCTDRYRFIKRCVKQQYTQFA